MVTWRRLALVLFCAATSGSGAFALQSGEAASAERRSGASFFGRGTPSAPSSSTSVVQPAAEALESAASHSTLVGNAVLSHTKAKAEGQAAVHYHTQAKVQTKATAKATAKQGIPGDPWTLGRPSDRMGDGVGWQWPGEVGERKRGGRAGHFNPQTQGVGQFNPGGGTVTVKTNRQADGMVATAGKDNGSAEGRAGPGKPMYPGGPMHRTYTGPLNVADIWAMQPPHIWMFISCCFGVCLMVPFLVNAGKDDVEGGPGLDAVGGSLSKNGCCAVILLLVISIFFYGMIIFCYQFGAWGLAVVALMLGALLVVTSLRTVSEDSGKADEGLMIHQTLMILGLILMVSTVFYFLLQFGLFDMIWRFHVMIWHNWWAYGLVFLLVLLGCCCFLRSRTADEMAQDYREEWNAMQPGPDRPGFRSFGEAIQSMG